MSRFFFLILFPVSVVGCGSFQSCRLMNGFRLDQVFLNELNDE